MITRMEVGLVLIATLVLGACTPAQPRNQASDIDRGLTPAEVNTQLAIGYMQQGRPDVALAKLERALEQDPNLPAAHNAMGLLRERLREFDKAETHFRRALALDPRDSSAHNNYGTFLCRRDRFREAEQQFLAAVENPLYLTPDEAYENAGLCALREPDRPKAEAYFRKALGLNARLPKSLFQMAQLDYDRGEYESARAYLSRYQAVSGHTAGSLWLAIQTERKLGNLDQAASYALLLRANFPESDEVRFLSAPEAR